MKEDNEDKFWERITEVYGGDFAHYLKSKFNLEDGLETSKNYYQKLIAVKNYYENNFDKIINLFNQSKYYWFDIYPTDWSKLLTPIEFDAWSAIRSIGRIILYPQFPVDKYFLDFANPGLKIGLELDGKNFHIIEKDIERDIYLKKLGWVIYRIPGKEMYRSDFTTFHELEYDYLSETEIEEKLSFWLCETGHGVIEAIKQRYFSDYKIADNEGNENDYYANQHYHSAYQIFQSLCTKTLELHCLT